MNKCGSRLALASFLFFLIKGLFWLLIPSLLAFRGCLS
jgi:hypothetical protein